MNNSKSISEAAKPVTKPAPKPKSQPIKPK